MPQLLASSFWILNLFLGTKAKYSDFADLDQPQMVSLEEKRNEKRL